ncbi:MAG: sulfatase, partial [Opitutae bacterium]
IRNDPHEVKNLASDPKYSAILEDLRNRLSMKVKSINDLSFFPESYMVRHALSDGIAYGEANSKRISNLVDIADLALFKLDEARPGLLKAMKSKDEAARYWACITCAVIGKADPALVKGANELLHDQDLMVRVRAAEFLGSVRAVDPMPTIYEVLNSATTEQELTLTLNTVVYLQDHKGYTYDPSMVEFKFKKGLVARRIEYLRN